MVRAKKTDFNFDDWIDFVPKSIKTSRSITDDQIRIAIKKNPRKGGIYIITFAFRTKIKKMLDSNEKSKIMPFKHKNDSTRILMTKSQNGYAVVSPNSSPDYFYFKCNFLTEHLLKEGAYVVDPIFHVKGKNSGSIIEIKIPDEAIDGK